MHGRWLAAFTGFLCGVGLLALWFSPRLIVLEPGSGVVPAREPIVLRFNTRLKPESVEASFSVSPQVVGSLSIDGASVRFVPADAWTYGQSFTVTLDRGVRGENGLPMLRKTQLRFRVRQPALLFLRQEGEATVLWRDLEGRLALVAEEELGIWDYSVSSREYQIVLSSIDANGSDDLFVVSAEEDFRELLLDCVLDQCRNARWQPGGALVAYERWRANEPEVWLLDTVKGESWPAHPRELLLEAGFSSLTSRAPRWSYDGRYLAYFQPEARVLVVLDMEGHVEPFVIPANLELMGEWSPNAYRLAYTELAIGVGELHSHVDDDGSVISHTETLLYSHAVVSDLVTGQSIDLSQGKEVSDGLPSWAPEGDRLVLGRTDSGSGRQLWIVYLDGREAEALTDDPLLNYTAPAWSPDGRTIAVMRSDLDEPNQAPVLWLLDLTNRRWSFVAERAYLPRWLP